MGFSGDDEEYRSTLFEKIFDFKPYQYAHAHLNYFF